jgi:hypothetical protein
MGEVGENLIVQMKEEVLEPVLFVKPEREIDGYSRGAQGDRVGQYHFQRHVFGGCSDYLDG